MAFIQRLGLSLRRFQNSRNSTRKRYFEARYNCHKTRRFNNYHLQILK